jgi:hypothetical protein
MKEMKKAVFTIVAKNYIGLAEVLGQSVRSKTDCDFFILVADEITPDVSVPSHVLIARDCLEYERSVWEKMSFQYNLVEFCTAIKPAAFQYFFDKRQFEKVIYADPDVFFFDSADHIFNDLDQYPILLTPHLLKLQTQFKGDYADYLFLSNGTFNLGFLALRKTGTVGAFLEWWHERLVNQCYFDFEKGMATDQKWINLLPGFFSSMELKVCFHKGMNVAPWNYHERKLMKQGDQWQVVDRETGDGAVPLVFVHFSGYDYGSFLRGQPDHKSESKGYADYEPIFREYAEALAKGDFAKFINLKYSYAFFDNGKNIISLNRRIFRSLTDEGKIYAAPFSTKEGSYYQFCKKAGLIDTSAVSADKITNRQIGGFSTKLKYINLFFTFVKFLLGVRRYSMMIRFFRRYFQEENQAFLLDRELGKKFK